MPSAREIAKAIGADLRGRNLPALTPASLSNACDGTVVFLAQADAEAAKRLNNLDVACVTTGEIAQGLTCTTLVHEQPKLAFCLLLQRFFEPDPVPRGTRDANVPEMADIAADVSIGPGSVIGPQVAIGGGTRIGSNVVIASGTRIGHDCTIKSNTTIGEPGFGFIAGPDKRPVRFPHVGSVAIGDRVEIGANCTVVRAALDATIIGDDVKTDDHVHIAHNVVIGARSLIAASAVLSGSVRMGSDVWVGPSAVIADHVAIGDGAWISLGSVVVRDVPVGGRVFGNPARAMQNREQS